MGYPTAPVDTSVTPLGRARDLFEFIKGGWAGSAQRYPGGVLWAQSPAVISGAKDRGTGPTGGFAKLGLHVYELAGKNDYHLKWAKDAYTWVRETLLTQSGDYAGKLYWDKVLASDGSIDTRYWSYNQGIMIGAGVLLYRISVQAGAPVQAYLDQAVLTADATIAYYNNVGWYSQPVIFNSLFFRNLLLLHAVNPGGYDRFRQAAQRFSNQVWDDTKIHNKQKHLIKFEEWTSAYKLREQAAMVQLFACLAWIDANKDLNALA